MIKTSDVIVIGGGLIGSATAYYLAMAGFSVTVMEARGLLKGGTASPASAGGVRQQGRDPAEMPLAIYSVNLWSSLSDELEADLHYRRRGLIVLCDREDGLAKLERRAATEKAFGVDVRLIGPDELRDLAPGVARTMLGGSYCPTDGQADPILTTAAFARAAQKLGVRYLSDCPVENLIFDKGRLLAVCSSKGETSCERAVLAAGAWSALLAGRAGLKLPIEPFGLQMMVTARRPPQLDQVLSWFGQSLSLKQSVSGGFVIGGGWPGRIDPATYRTELLPGAMAKSARLAVSAFPSLKDIPVVRGWVGIEAYTPDHLPIIGEFPDHTGLVLAAGFSGHGFAISPGVGRLLAEYFVTGQWPRLLTPFQPGRFGNTYA